MRNLTRYIGGSDSTEAQPDNDWSHAVLVQSDVTKPGHHRGTSTVRPNGSLRSKVTLVRHVLGHKLALAVCLANSFNYIPRLPRQSTIMHLLSGLYACIRRVLRMSRQTTYTIVALAWHTLNPTTTCQLPLSLLRLRSFLLILN